MTNNRSASEYPLNAQSLRFIKEAKEQLSTCVTAFDGKITELQIILERLEDTGAANFIEDYALRRKLLIETNAVLVEIWNSEINSTSELLERSEPLLIKDGMLLATKLHNVNKLYIDNFRDFAQSLASFPSISTIDQKQKDAVELLRNYIKEATDIPIPPSASSQLQLAAQAILNNGQENTR